MAIEHAKLFEEHNLARGRDKFFSMRKHLAWYIKAIPGAAQLRTQLVKTMRQRGRTNFSKLSN